MIDAIAQYQDQEFIRQRVSGDREPMNQKHGIFYCDRET